MMDNLAADVPGSAPLITVPEEASDWSSSSLLRLQLIHHGLKLEAALERERPGADVTEPLEPHQDLGSSALTFLIRCSELTRWSGVERPSAGFMAV